MSTFIGSLLKYLHYSRKCKDKDFFEYEDLVKYDFNPPKHFQSVFLYGNYKAIAKLSHKRFNFFTDYLEHGVCFIQTPESSRLMGYVDRPFISRIYTFGSVRNKFITQYLDSKKRKRKVIEVGPYILGAKNFYDANVLHDLKNKIGKMLLVYPQHSIENSNVEYEIDDLIGVIKSKSSFFDSIFVCLYWKDILLHPDYVERYKKAGFVVVSNGHRSDPMFLSRQKDLIMLSDMMITNGLGTHIGYSICLNKPVCFYKQEVLVNKKTHSEILNPISEVESVFSEMFREFSFAISEEQVNLVKHYWGDWDVKTDVIVDQL